ncbi:MAG: hypothetical protein IJY97_05155 [Clostridia bacterium]|nr:hypothetical protein [Clostridia bacterium]
MKRIFSALLSLAMILALVAAMGISASAKEGDVLRKINFKNDDKYSFNMFATNGKADGVTAEVSEDGSAATITVVTKSKRYFYGDILDGLKIGEGKKYTVEVLADNSVEGKNAMQNFGVYINGNEDILTADYATINANNSKFTDGFNAMRGYYGTPEGWNGTPKNTLSRGAGNKIAGLYISDGSNYVGGIYEPDADGFCKVSIEVDGYVFRVFINGQFFDEGYIPVTNRYDDLAVIFYVYNAGSVTFKDAVVYEGNIYSAKGFTYPALREGAVKEDWSGAMALNAKELTMDAYAKAGLCAKLTDVNFKNGTEFDPKMLYQLGTELSIKVSDDGSQIDFEKPTDAAMDGAGQGATWWGGAIGSLEYTADTIYTFTYKVKSNELRGGTLFSLDETNMNSNSACPFNFYGNFNGTGDSDMVIEYTSTKIKGHATVKTTSYTKFSALEKNIAYDADGYADMAVTVDGYTWNIFYKDAAGEWVLFETYNGTKAEFANCPEVACGIYIYHDMATYGMKDVALYKGTLTDIANYVPPVETEPEVTEPADPVPTGDSALIFAVVAIISVLGVATIAKRREN